jgi:hypothetical protein
MTHSPRESITRDQYIDLQRRLKEVYRRKHQVAKGSHTYISFANKCYAARLHGAPEEADS